MKKKLARLRGSISIFIFELALNFTIDLSVVYAILIISKYIIWKLF